MTVTQGDKGRRRLLKTECSLRDQSPAVPDRNQPIVVKRSSRHNPRIAQRLRRTAEKCTDVYQQRQQEDVNVLNSNHKLTEERHDTTCQHGYSQNSSSSVHHDDVDDEADAPLTSFQIAHRLLSLDLHFPLLSSSSASSLLSSSASSLCTTSRIDECAVKSSFDESRLKGPPSNTSSSSSSSSSSRPTLPSVSMYPSLVGRHDPDPPPVPTPGPPVRSCTSLAHNAQEVTVQPLDQVLTGKWSDRIYLRHRSRSYDSLMDCVTSQTSLPVVQRRSSNHIPFSLQEKRSSNTFKSASVFLPMTPSSSHGYSDANTRVSTANAYGIRMTPATLYKRQSSFPVGSGVTGVKTPGRTPNNRPLLRHRQTSTGSLSTDTSTSTPGSKTGAAVRLPLPHTDSGVSKCRRWMDTLPDKFSGLHVFLPPITHDSPPEI